MKKLITLIGLTLLILLEVGAAQLAYYSLGDVTSSLYYFLIVLNLVPIVFLFKQWNKEGGVFAQAFILLIALIILPYQGYLGQKMILLQEETSNIVAHLYQHQAETNQWPANLSGYTFEHPHLKTDIDYNLNEEGFFLSYHIGTPNTSHYFNSSEGRWGYYAD